MCGTDIKYISLQELDIVCSNGIYSPLNSTEAFELTGKHDLFDWLLDAYNGHKKVSNDSSNL